MAILCILVLAIFCLVIVRSFQRATVLQTAYHWAFGQRIYDKLARKWSHIPLHGCIAATEWRKALFRGKAFWIFLLLAVLLFNRVQNSFRFYDIEHQMYAQFIEKFQEDVSEDTLERITEERTNVAASDFNQYLKDPQLKALERIEIQTRRVLELEANTGIPAHLVNDDAYAEWMDNPREDFRDILFVYLTAILASAGIFARENAVDAKKLLRISPLHRKLRRSKITIALVFSLLACVMVTSARYFEFAKFSQLTNLTSPIQSHESWENFPLLWDMRTYFGCVILIRFLSSLALGCFLAAVSARAKNESIAAVILSALCIFPAIAMNSGVREVQYFSLAWTAEANVLLKSPVWLWAWALVFLVLVTVGSLVSIKKEWQPQVA